MDDIATPAPASRVRPRIISLAAVLIAVSGGLDIIYAPLVVLAPFFDEPTPGLLVTIGAASVVTAFGIWRLWGWGRVLGVGLCLVGIAQVIVTLVAIGVDGAGLGVLPLAIVTLAWSIALAGLPLWALIRRWPPGR
jgi:hypothetical protein